MIRKSSSRSSSDSSVGLQFAFCTTTAFTLALPDDFDRSLPLSFATDFCFEGDAVRGTVSLIITTSARMPSMRRSKPIVTLSTESTFIVQGADANIAMPETALPAWAVATMISVAVGTTRGILLAKLSGTPIEGTLLPIINLGTVLPAAAASEVAPQGV